MTTTSIVEIYETTFNMTSFHMTKILFKNDLMYHKPFWTDLQLPESLLKV